ncbi:hypothetical protein CBS101457_006386 [Exobasidium rhododendri]|nr:hypothetical protein CBS101457_006386 [Exobasidium rhododendri]
MASSPFPTRSRLSRTSLSTPNRNDKSNENVLHPPSTPYDIFQRNHSPLPSTSAISATPSSHKSSVYLPSSRSQPILTSYLRNVGFGSPGVGRSPRYSSTGVGSSAETDSPRPMKGLHKGPNKRTQKFIRRKSLKQRALDLPATIYDLIIFSPILDFNDPALGYPAGLLLHGISFITLVIHPEGALHLSWGGGGRQLKAKGLFADQSSLGGGLASKRRQSQDDAWRWFAIMIAYILLTVAFANAYHLFTARRRYHLWMKSTSDKISSDNASLVDLPQDTEKKPRMSSLDAFLLLLSKLWTLLATGLMWLLEHALHRLRQVPYLGVVITFLFPPTIARRMRQPPSAPLDSQMYAIDMWTAPEVQLRIFCLYSPLHALFYLLSLKSDFSRFITTFAFMVIVSAQTTLLVRFYTDLVKDKNIIAGEVMHEYNEKFVFPRAQPMCRDASTMTDEAEASSKKRMSWLNRRHSSEGEERSEEEFSRPSSKRKTQRACRKTLTTH